MARWLHQCEQSLAIRVSSPCPCTAATTLLLTWENRQTSPSTAGTVQKDSDFLETVHAPFMFTLRFWVPPLCRQGHCSPPVWFNWGITLWIKAWKKHNAPAVLPRSPWQRPGLISPTFSLQHTPRLSLLSCLGPSSPPQTPTKGMELPIAQQSLQSKAGLLARHFIRHDPSRSLPWFPSHCTSKRQSGFLSSCPPSSGQVRWVAGFQQCHCSGSFRLLKQSRSTKGSELKITAQIRTDLNRPCANTWTVLPFP